MTSIKILRLLVGATLVLTVVGVSQPAEKHLVDLAVFDTKGDYFGNVVRDGDRFVALRFRYGDGISRPRNCDPAGELLKVDRMFLGYDLRGKSKNVLVREGRGTGTKAFRWECVLDTVPSGKERMVVKRFRVVNGDLKGWWIGLGPLEEAKGGERPRDQRPRARLILVKDKKDAASFTWDDPTDEGR